MNTEYFILARGLQRHVIPLYSVSQYYCKGKVVNLNTIHYNTVVLFKTKMAHAILSCVLFGGKQNTNFETRDFSSVNY